LKKRANGLLSELSLDNETIKCNQLVIKKLGFRLGPSDVHIGRTLMLEDLRDLLLCVPDQNSQKKEYVNAIIADNCLGKRSQKNLELSARFGRINLWENSDQGVVSSNKDGVREL
jgi:hypothetical protein